MTWDPLVSAYVPSPIVYAAGSNEDLVLFAIDPGPEHSAAIAYSVTTSEIRNAGTWPNEELVGILHTGLSPTVARVVIEKVESFGMPVGAEVLETVFWSGRFAEAARPRPVERIGRKKIKLHLCGTSAAKDPNVRQALLDRFGGSAAKGTKKAPGPLYGIANDLWSALAVAVTAGDMAA